MKKTAAVLVKIDKITKEKMKKLKINWSEEIRNFPASEYFNAFNIS